MILIKKDGKYIFPFAVPGGELDWATGAKLLRRSLNLSTKEFGALCGVSHRSVENWEQGRKPSLSAVICMWHNWGEK